MQRNNKFFQAQMEQSSKAALENLNNYIRYCNEARFLNCLQTNTLLNKDRDEECSKVVANHDKFNFKAS